MTDNPESLDKYIEQIFPILCKGRVVGGKDALKTPTYVEVKVYKKPGQNTISSLIECPYNCGPHGEKCRATNKKVKGDKQINELPTCVYAFDIPYALELYNSHIIIPK